MQDHERSLRDHYSNPVCGLLAMLLRPQTDYRFSLPTPVEEAIQHLMTHQGDIKAAARRVFDVLLLLWTRRWTPTEDQTIADPTIRFLALSSLKSDGGFKDASAITPELAKFQYCMRLVFLKAIHEEGGDVLEKCRQMQPWFTEKHDTTFNTIRSLQHRASDIVYRTINLPNIWWIDEDDFQTLLYKGDRIQFADIRRMISRLQLDMKAKWEQDVLCGLNIRVSYGRLCDDLSCKEVGYSFLSDQRNKCFLDPTLLASAILSDPVLRGQFIIHDTSVWNVHRLRQWLVNYCMLTEWQLVAAGITTGSPSRGTELTSMTLVNSAEYPLRNLVVFGEYLTLLCTYQKTSALTGNDRCIPHALDAFCSDLMVQSLAIARPFAIFAVSLIYPGQPGVIQLYQKHLFVNHAKLFVTEDITAVLQKITLVSLGCRLGVNGWRHVSTAFRRKLCTRMDELVEQDEMESIEALQSGHSRQTENRVYGVSADALAGASEDILPLFLKASTDWQVECHLVPGGLPLAYSDALMDRFEALKEEGRIKKHQNDKVMLAKTVKRLEAFLSVLEQRFGVGVETYRAPPTAVKRATVFEDQAMRVKQRRIARGLQDIEYIASFKLMLKKYGGICMPCFLFKVQSPLHKMTECPTMLKATALQEYLEWDRQICYGKHHPSICFLCHIPQCHDVLHPTFASDGSACEHPLLIAPLAYGITQIQGLKERAEGYFQTTWPNPAILMKWINGEVVPDHQSNLTALCLWFSKEIDI